MCACTHLQQCKQWQQAESYLGCWVNGAHPPMANAAGYFGNSKALSNINDKQPESDSERSFPQAFLLPGPAPLLSIPRLYASS